MYNSFKLKKIVLNNFKIFKEIQKINFVNDNDKKVVLIIGNNDSGKTILFNAIKAGLSSTNEKESICFLDTNFDKSLITENNKWMFCLNVEELECNLYEKHKEFLTSKVVEKMNEFLLIYYPYKYEFKNFILGNHNEIHLLNHNDNDCIGTLAATDKLLVNLWYMLAVKYFLFENSFLVLDFSIGRLSKNKIISIITSIIDNCNQLILLTLPVEIMNCIDDENQSIEEIIKNKTAYLKFTLTYIPEKDCTEIKQYD